VAKEYARTFYNSKAWKKCKRGYILSVNGLCERCLKQGKYVPGYIVHHKQYITPSNINDPNITLNWGNLEYVCQDCHNKEHQQKYGATREGLTFNENGELVEVAPPIQDL
jgi:5-methylcytosine-specific restriction protein A